MGDNALSEEERYKLSLLKDILVLHKQWKICEQRSV